MKTIEPTALTASQLMTGKSYLDSLRDGRRVYIDGGRVTDVTTHPAFRNSARSIARLYNALHDERVRDIMTTIDGDGLVTHRFFTSSYSSADLLKAREAIAHWARLTFGFMGRTPDYKAGFTATLGSYPEFYAPFAENAKRWYRRAAERALFLSHVLVNPPVDRNRPVHEVEDVFTHVVRERDDGIVVRGAKMVATSSAICNAAFVAQNSAVSFERGKAEDYALVFIVPMSADGCRILSRNSYEAAATSPFDYPLSSRFDENDAVLVFDDVFVPWDDVLVYRDVDKASAFYAESGFLNRYPLQSGTRLAVKLDFLVGLLISGLRANGTFGFRGVQAKVGEVVAWRNLMWSLSTAMCTDTEPGPGGAILPRLEIAATSRYIGTCLVSQVKEIFETTLGAAPIAIPSGAADLRSAELRPLIDKFYRGSDRDAASRIKLFKLIWDALGTEFGGRHELYERNYAGNDEQVRLDLLAHTTRRGVIERCVDLVRGCMDDYDLDGWTTGPWVPRNGIGAVGHE